MPDIKNAYLSEVEYQLTRSRDETTESLIDRVREYGFSTLEEYFSAKADYMVELMDFSFLEVYPENAAAEMLKMNAKAAPGLLMMNTDKTVVYHGNVSYNADYCEEHNIPVIEYKTAGGTLVASAGELSIGVCIPTTADVSTAWLLEHLAAILRKYMGNVVVDNNDILVDGKKVCGAAAYKSNVAYCAVAQFSFDDKTALIQNICPPKKKSKQAGYITAMTREQLRREIQAWLL